MKEKKKLEKKVSQMNNIASAAKPKLCSINLIEGIEISSILLIRYSKLFLKWTRE